MKGGQLVAAFAVEDELELAFADAPTATLEEMLGLFVVMKLPQICLNARARSGPMFAAAGPKSDQTESVGLQRCKFTGFLGAG